MQNSRVGIIQIYSPPSGFVQNYALTELKSKFCRVGSYGAWRTRDSRGRSEPIWLTVGDAPSAQGEALTSRRGRRAQGDGRVKRVLGSEVRSIGATARRI